MAEVTRRSLLGWGGTALGVAAFGALGVGSRQGLVPRRSGGDPDALTMSFYSEGKRAQLHLEAIQSFERANPGVSVTSQYQAVSGYDEKLSTQMAGGNEPNIFEMAQPTFAEYISRGVVRTLDDLVPGVLPYDTLPDQLRDACRYEGHYYAIPLGLSTTPGVFIDSHVLEDLGVDVPAPGWTVDDLVRFAARVRDASGGRIAGSVDMGGTSFAFAGFLAGEGTVPFTDDGRAAFSRDQLGRWFELWAGLRRDRSVPPMEITSGVTGFSNDPVISGQAALTVQAASKALTGLQPLTKHQLAIVTFPRQREGGPAATALGPIEWFALSHRLDAAKARLAARLCFYLSDDVGAVKTLDLSHGVPLLEKTREVTVGSATPIERRLYDAVSTVVRDGPAPRPTYPVGSSEVLATLTQQNEELGFGRTTTDRAVDQVFADAERFLQGPKGPR